jgi:hypothetical protein
MKRASTIHLYTSTPPLTCDGRRESQHVDTDKRRESQHVDTNGRRESQHVDTKGGDSNFTINCENQDSNSRPWALIPCQASCTSQRNQKSELMERASTIHLYTSTPITAITSSIIISLKPGSLRYILTILWQEKPLEKLNLT